MIKYESKWGLLFLLFSIQIFYLCTLSELISLIFSSVSLIVILIIGLDNKYEFIKKRGTITPEMLKNYF